MASERPGRCGVERGRQAQCLRRSRGRPGNQFYVSDVAIFLRRTRLRCDMHVILVRPIVTAVVLKVLVGPSLLHVCTKPRGASHRPTWYRMTITQLLCMAATFGPDADFASIKCLIDLDLNKSWQSVVSQSIIKVALFRGFAKCNGVKSWMGR